MIESVVLEEFSGFAPQKFDFCPGLNVLIGINGSGKSHLMKLLYSIWKTWEVHGEAETGDLEIFLKQKLASVFKPQGNKLERLVRRRRGQNTAKVSLSGAGQTLEFQISAKGVSIGQHHPTHIEDNAIFLPSREVLAMYAGFIHAYQNRILSFDETYFDLCVAMSGSTLRGVPKEEASALAKPLEKILGGKVRLEGDEFKVKLKNGDMESHLLAEGLRKIASVIHLIRNGTLGRKSILFWDEPEANLNPQLVVKVVETLLALAASGMQIFIASHDFLMTHELSLRAEYKKNKAPMRFFSLYPSEEGVIHSSGEVLAELERNTILDEFSAHYDREQAYFNG